MHTITEVRQYSNLNLAYRRLITNPESTYKNYFRNEYNAYALALEDNLKNIRTKMKAGFMPESTIRVFMPKSTGMSRMYTLLSVEDQIVYQAFANVIAEAICTEKVKNRYKKSVFGNLYSGKGSEFFYQRWQDSYKAYTKAIIRAFESGNTYIASFDLTACYDSINHELIQDILKKNHLSDSCVTEFIRLLEKWESSDGFPLGSGIPQGPQASGIVAEAVLFEYDAYIEQLQRKYEFKYFRYVDDIRILAKDKHTVEWILFLLDKKSKELGLFPQMAKIAVHEIADINAEIKRISKPLFDEDLEAKEKSVLAQKNISILLKETPPDLTSIRRYFQAIEHSSKANKIAISAVRKYPNLIHSFAYYVLRYPRKIPQSIFDYICECCRDKTRQFSAGLLLQSSINNLNTVHSAQLSLLAENLLKRDKKEKFIVDCRFRAELILADLLYRKYSDKVFLNRVLDENNWWIKKELLFQLKALCGDSTRNTELARKSICDKHSDVALIASSNIVSSQVSPVLPAINTISPIAQNTLKRSGIIQRSRYSNSQINRYIGEITGVSFNFSWKKHLKNEHDKLERSIFTAYRYWSTDLTAFVNLWDTIDDRLCSILFPQHPELGGYTLGSVGGIKDSKKLLNSLPHFSKMVNTIHELRLSSHLSHSKVKSTGIHTGPIPQKERRRIKKLIGDGITELVNFW